MLPRSMNSLLIHSISSFRRRNGKFEAIVLNRALSYKKDPKVEIIDNRKKGKETTHQNSREEEQGNGIVGTVRNAVTSVASSVTKMFGFDEESMKKKKAKDQINSEIDKMFANAPPLGILGRVLKQVVKITSGRAVDLITKSAQEMEDVKADALNLITMDKECTEHLGIGPIDIFQAASVNSSTIVSNGKAVRNVMLVFPFQANLDSGLIHVTAHVSSKAAAINTPLSRSPLGSNIEDIPVSIQSLSVQLSSGKTIVVKGERSRGSTIGKDSRVIDI
jgi:hypothetical protein